jgi:hypothetical protein
MTFPEMRSSLTLSDRSNSRSGMFQWLIVSKTLVAFQYKFGATVPYQPRGNPLNVGFQRSKVKVTAGGRHFGPMFKDRQEILNCLYLGNDNS